MEEGGGERAGKRDGGGRGSWRDSDEWDEGSLSSETGYSSGSDSASRSEDWSESGSSEEPPDEGGEPGAGMHLEDRLEGTNDEKQHTAAHAAADTVETQQEEHDPPPCAPGNDDSTAEEGEDQSKTSSAGPCPPGPTPPPTLFDMLMFRRHHLRDLTHLDLSTDAINELLGKDHDLVKAGKRDYFTGKRRPDHLNPKSSRAGREDKAKRVAAEVCLSTAGGGFTGGHP